MKVGVSFCTNCGTSVSNPDLEIRKKSISTDFYTEEKITRVWLDFKPLLSLYSLLMLIIFISYLIRDSNPAITSTVWGAITCLTIYFGNHYSNYLSDLFKFHKVPLKDVLQILFIAIFLFFFLKIYFYSFKVFHFNEIKITGAIKKHHWPIWSAFILISVFPGILEEIIFRGIIYTKLKDIFEVKEALIIQAACFSVMHLSPFIFISHFLMGLFLGFIREKTSTLYFSMLFHMAWNAYIVWGEIQK
ncbi:MAG: CPBP family intramembrane metalloprotease [Rhizobacter sp.]|nr:CPBP family intramembrane metalloprotease [Bacteriovorax sp.]